MSVWNRFAPSATGSQAEAINPELLGSWSLINRPKWRMAPLVKPGVVLTLGDPVKCHSVMESFSSRCDKKINFLIQWIRGKGCA